MNKQISQLGMAVATVLIGSAAALAQTASHQGVLTSAVNDYTNEFDQSMAGNWNGDGCCGDGCCGGDSCGAGGCGAGGCGGSCCDAGGLCDNIELFAAGDGWANHGDDDDGNNFGYHVGANSAFGGSKIRVQAGGSYGFYNFHGREDPDQEPSERQVFLTGGVYKRSNVSCGDCCSWGVVYDYMNANNWGEEADAIDLSQIRGQFGFALNRCNELGVWGATSLDDDVTANLGNGVRVQARDQINLYWLHQYEFGAETMVYAGLADEPLGIGQNFDSPNLREVVIGLRGRAPMSRYMALYGNAVYVLPGTTGGDTGPNGVDNSYAEEAWNITVGLTFYPGAKARSRTVSGPAGLPLIPVADNGTFAVNTPAGAL